MRNTVIQRAYFSVCATPTHHLFSFASTHSISATPRSRFFSTTPIQIDGFVKKLTSDSPKIAVIPKALQNKQLQEITRTIIKQRFGRLGGAILYPSIATIAVFTGNISIGISLLAYTPFCVGLHHMAIKRACEAASDLVRRQQVFNNDANANTGLKKWMLKNDITKLSFNKEGDLILFHRDQVSSSSGLTWLDQTKLDTDSQWSKSLVLSINSSPFQEPLNSISYFHLTDDIREQVTHLINARSRRFRGPVLLGAAGFVLSTLSAINNPILGLFTGAIIGHVENHHNVDQNMEKLSELIKQKTRLINIIAPEYQERYVHLENINDSVRVMVNFFGNIVVNPAFSLRSCTSISFPSSKSHMKKISEQHEESTTITNQRKTP
ncbi:MAG: hypothetical protein ACHP65_09700 [Legionellales bacterium]